MSKEQPDINDTLCAEGPDAVRQRHDDAHAKTAIDETLAVFE